MGYRSEGKMLEVCTCEVLSIDNDLWRFYRLLG